MGMRYVGDDENGWPIYEDDGEEESPATEADGNTNASDSGFWQEDQTTGLRYTPDDFSSLNASEEDLAGFREWLASEGDRAAVNVTEDGLPAPSGAVTTLVPPNADGTGGTYATADGRIIVNGAEGGANIYDPTTGQWTASNGFDNVVGANYDGGKSASPLDAINKALGTNINLADLIKGGLVLGAGYMGKEDAKATREELERKQLGDYQNAAATANKMNSGAMSNFMSAFNGIVPGMSKGKVSPLELVATQFDVPTQLYPNAPRAPTPPPATTTLPQLPPIAQTMKRGGALKQIKNDPVIHKYLRSPKGGGQDDIIPIMAAPGEYVFDADAVAALGDGNSDEGARRLDKMRENIRTHKRGASAKSIPPKAKAPEQYMKGGKA